MRIFKNNWGQWKDVSTGSLCSYKYILQARRHKNGKIQMRVEEIKAYDTVAHPTLEQLSLITFEEIETPLQENK
jgi:hypothetical protein